MRNLRCLSRRSVRAARIFVCLTLTVLMQVGWLSPLRPGVSARNDQSNIQALKAPPRAPEKGAPEFAAPNLRELRQRANQLPSLPAAVPATVRPKTKSLIRRSNTSVQTATPGTRSVMASNLANASHNHRTVTIPPIPPPGVDVSARVEPSNQPNSGLLTRDASWNLPIITLPGRAGLDLGLTLSYSSMVWIRSGNTLSFDDDNGSPSPGFRLGFPTVQGPLYDAELNTDVYLLLGSSGRRVRLRPLSGNVYEAGDSSYLQITANGSSLVVRAPDGTRMIYVLLNSEWRCSEVKDRNGNLISITNDAQLGHITQITDTLGRVLRFNYDGNACLNSIERSWGNGFHTWATFGWGAPVSMDASGFTGVTVAGTYTGEQIPVLRQVSLATGSYYTFEYNSVGQIKIFRRYTSADNNERFRLSYDYDSPTNDCPRLTRTRTWVSYWTGYTADVPEELVTEYSGGSDHSWARMVSPDGTVHKEFFETAHWKRGLTSLTKIYVNAASEASDTWVKFNQQTWDHDGGANATYATNPRLIETNVVDSYNNQRRTTIDYGPYSQFGLPFLITEYGGPNGGATAMRRTYLTYLTDSPYTVDRRIFGLLSGQYVYDQNWSLVAKTEYHYDTGGDQMQDLPAMPTQHDAGYNAATIIGRGNLCEVAQFDTNGATNFHSIKYGYDIAGNTTFTRDAAGHQSSVSYVDAFSDNTNRNTFAYPTLIKDADWNALTSPNNFSTVQFSYDLGQPTQTQGPPPAGQAQGAMQTMLYDDAGRLVRVTNNLGAYTRYVYGSYWIQSWSTINNIADASFTNQIFDGVGHVLGVAGFHPGSAGGYRAQRMRYDLNGRLRQHSNPTEVNENWEAFGDDAAGWQYNNATEYDSQGRPTRIFNMDGSYQQASYQGCGCAGGQVVTLTDEVNRQQKIYSDVLGRKWKTELLNWPDQYNNRTVYSTITNTFNGRDQLTNVRQADNATGVYQDTIFSYDGYGRLSSKHVPEQTTGTATVYTYSTDDTILSVTDPRGVMATYGYNNNRHLVNTITYSAPSGITPTPNVTFAYDDAANRTSMTDGLGTTAYSYNQLSQLMSETRTFNDPTNSAINGVSKTFSYGYNLDGELIQLVDQNTGRSLNYSHDAVGRLTSVSGSGFGAVSAFANNFTYRASGTAKHFDYGNGTFMNLSYNSRGLTTQYSLGGIKEPNGSPRAEGSDFQYYADGRLKFATDHYERSFNAISNHDRAYQYDQVGRLQKGMSAVDANDFINGTQSGNHSGPFQQIYNFDVWNNLISRTGRYWGEDDTIGTQTYDGRNRNTAWSYDASGTLLSMNEPAPDELTFVPAQHSYDASGRHIQVTQTTSTPSAFNPNLVLTTAATTRDEYDGDGLQLKQIISKQVNGGQPQSLITYYLRSSVLGGNIIAEYDGQGTEKLSRVFAEGEQIASLAGGGVEWRYVNPVTRDVRESDAQGKIGATTHLDPEGVDVGPTDPASIQGEANPPAPLPQAGAYASLLPRSAGGMRTCKLEGFAIGCGWVTSLENTGHVAPVNQIQFLQRRWVKPSPIGLRPKLPANPFDNFLTNAGDGTPIVRVNALEPQGHWETTTWMVSFPEIPQSASGLTPGEIQRARKGIVNARKLLAQKDCGSFVNAVFERAASQVPSYLSADGESYGGINAQLALQLYEDDLNAGRIIRGGKGAQGDGVVLATTNSNRQITLNQEFLHDLNDAALGFHTAHESFHQIKGFSDAILANAALWVDSKQKKSGKVYADTPAGVGEASRDFNNILKKYCPDGSG